MRRHLIVLATAAFGLAAGCNSTDTPQTKGDPGAPGSVRPQSENAVGWDEIDVIAAGAEVKIDSMGHFATSRNLCSFVADGGAYNTAQWDPMAVSANALVTAEMVTGDDETCYDVADTCMTSYGRIDSVDMKLPNGKRELLYRRGIQLCTKLKDIHTAQDLSNALNQMLPQALWSGCDKPPC